MKELIERYTDTKRVSKGNPEYAKLRNEIKKLANQNEINDLEKLTLSKLTEKLRKTPSVIRTKDTGIRVFYNRYADD
jgi:hypothetical protein